MSDTNGDEHISGHGFTISTETIAKGAIRIKTKIWLDHLDLEKGIVQSADLYEKTLQQYRQRGFHIDGDP